MAAHQATASLGFSREERWNGLPFPSPMHGSEKRKWSHSVMFDSSWPHGLQPTRLLRPWYFPGKSTGVGCHRCLLNISCIFSILVSSLFICNYILFSRFGIIFTIIILNYFSGRMPISSSFLWFSGFLSCSFTCWVILFRFLCLGCPFCRLEVHGSS